MSIRDRVIAVLEGRKPDRHPFIDRLELWFSRHERSGGLPAPFTGMSLNEVHRAIGFGQERFVIPYGLELHGVEVRATLNGEDIYRETDPVIKAFPGMWTLIPEDRAGRTEIHLTTPAGRLRLAYEQLETSIEAGAEAYPVEHLIKGEDDFRVVEWILDRAEFVPMFEDYFEEERRIGDIGYVVPLIHRIPFQQLLLEYLGEQPLIYALCDTSAQVERLLKQLHDQMLEILHHLRAFNTLYIEFPDNLHGPMTSPKLFKDFCLLHLQRYTDILHGQGKKVGSHTDGELRPLLGLLAESGLDVCESITPAPLTRCTFEEFLEAWRNGPIIWGGIPSSLLESRTPEGEFREFVHRILELVGGDPILLGVGDMVMGNNSIDRVRYIVEAVEAHPLGV